MDLTMEYEFQPVGSVLIHIGGIKQDDGGSWLPVVYQVGPNQFQSGVAPAKRGNKSRAIVHRALLSDLGFAQHVADELARLAAA